MASLPDGITLDIPDLRVSITPRSEYVVKIQPVDEYHTVVLSTPVTTRATSVFVDSAQSASYATYAVSASYFSQGTVETASYATTAVTASYVTGSTSVIKELHIPIPTGSIVISGSVESGIFSETKMLSPAIPTSSFSGCNVDYRAWRSGSVRQGMIMASWLGSGSNEIAFTDVSHASIGDTTDIAFDFILNQGNAHLRMNSYGTGSESWTIQTFFRLFPIY